jgi:hypothetical protein
MAAVSVFTAVPAAAGRVSARLSSASRSSAFAGAESKRVIVAKVSIQRRGAVAVTARRADISNPHTSPIVKANNGETHVREKNGMDVNRVTRSLTRVVEALWGARRGFALVAFSIALALVDADAAVAGRGGGRSGGRMGGSSFRSSSRSMGGGMGGMGGMGGAGAMGAGAAGAARVGATGAGAATAPRMGMGMPSLFFMPSFGYGYGYGIGGGYIVMKVLVQMYMMYMIYSYLFGPRGGRGSGSNATGS